MNKHKSLIFSSLLICCIILFVYFTLGTSGFKTTKKVAEQGDAGAQYILGYMYADGKGVPEDDAEAIHWYRKAAEQGHTEAQYNLGVMYEQGEGVQKDEVVAMR